LNDLRQPPEPAIPSSELAQSRTDVSLWHLFLCFIKIGVTSFGGSTQAWIFRAIVEERQWLTENDFLTGLTIAQILPGANPVNLSLYVGQRLRGSIGALVATLGMVVPAICIVLIVGAVYARLAHFPLTHFLLIGIATVGVGATLAAGLKVVRKIEREPAIILVGLATFVTVGVLHWSMAPVVVVLAPISVALAARRSNG
jgi:chromate transporter